MNTVKPTPNVVVYGLWHLGCVICASIANAGFHVVAIDDDGKNIDNLNMSEPPIYEPGLIDLIKANLGGTLFFSSDKQEMRGADLIIVSFDTPVDEDDIADVELVKDKIQSIFSYIKSGAVVLITSQLPVGTTAELQRMFNSVYASKQVIFAYTPENLRLGCAIEAFNYSDRVVIGVDDEVAKLTLETVFSSFTQKIVWTKIESAEMVKHALNAFLATSIAFINEIAVICENVGADAYEVSQGLKTEARIGPQAYLNPGGAFAGGTLARDVNFLSMIADKHHCHAPVIKGIGLSNDLHKGWIKRKIAKIYSNLSDKKVTLLGLSYKPDSDVLRRSYAIDIALWLAGEGAVISAFDPNVGILPEGLQFIKLTACVTEAIMGSDLLLVMQNGDQFLSIEDRQLNLMRKRVILDQNRIFGERFVLNPNYRYFSVGVDHEA